MHPNCGIEVIDLCYARGSRVLFESLSFTVNKGSLLQIVGPNGSGKSTLLRILTGLLRPDRGQIRYHGALIDDDMSSYQKNLFYLDHAIAIKPQLSVLENIQYDTRLPHLSLDEIAHALSRWGLGSYHHQRGGQLSRGQQQRVALTKLLCSQGSLFILDEPLTALDDAAVAIMQQIILELLTRGGIVILSSHRLLPLADCEILTLGLNEPK